MSSVNLISRFGDFFRSFRDENGKPYYLNKIRIGIADGQLSLYVQFDDLEKFDSMLGREIINNPAKALLDGTDALEEVINTVDSDFLDGDTTVHFRLTDLPKRSRFKLRTLRSKDSGSFIQIEGTVAKVNSPKQVLSIGDFKCKYCNNVQQVIQYGNRFTFPVKCEMMQCGKSGAKAFSLLANTSKRIDWQSVVIQESPEEVMAGRMPLTVKAYLTHDIVGAIRPGDHVILVGTVKVVAPRDLKPGEMAILSTYFEVNSFKRIDEEFETIKFSPNEIQKFIELSKDPRIHGMINASIAPSIYGHVAVKEAIGLMIFGGTGKKIADGTTRRGESNVLLIGDPGMGKSEILLYVYGLVPKGVFSSGKGSSAAGLTAAVVKDTESGEFVLEPGALVLADGGIAIIDEFDKMRTEDRSALHQAMEQHKISISKAGIVATMNARASILAAANPKLGRWDPNLEPIANLNLPPTILSRFDLVFVMADEPDPERDEKTADFVLKLHSTGELPASIVLEKEFLKKYIAYSRQNFSPKLSSEATSTLKAFYLKLRSLTAAIPGSRSVAITVRYLESLIRLAEARAKQALREIVTKEDAKAAVELMIESLKQIALDPVTGMIDIDRLTSGKSTTAQTMMHQILGIIERLTEKSDDERKMISIAAIKKKAVEEKQMKEDAVDKCLEILFVDGNIFRPDDDYVCLL